MNIKTAVITGASGGIGKAIAKKLSEKDYNLILLGRNPQKMDELVSELKKECASDIFPYLCDFEKLESVRKTVADIKSKFERIDILINNAGIYKPGTLELNSEDFISMLQVNLIAPFEITKSLVNNLSKSRSAYVINLVSRSGKIGFPQGGVYSSTKFGLTGLNEALYKKFALENIKFTAICPSWVDTEMAQQTNPSISKDRMIRPVDIANTIDYLLNLPRQVSIKEIVMECTDKVY